MVAGRILAERFELASIAGAGGMGSVWRAHDRATGNDVAVKLHRPVATGSDAPTGSADARFDRESRLLAEMRHPAIVRYVAHGIEPGGERWLAMEWIEGESLHARLKRGPLPIAHAVELARRVAEGLAYAHQAGIVHRDVKPGNVLLERGDPCKPKLVDFGLARPVGPTDLTSTRVFVGTPGYVAPEQARGLADVDGRADLYSLGCLLFVCVTGRKVFGSDDDALAALAKTLLDEPPRLSTVRGGVPPSLDDLVARLLRKDPDARPRTATAVAEELAVIEAREPTESTGAVTVAGHEPPETAVSESRHHTVLTSGEQRVVSVVLTTAPPPGDEPAGDSLEARMGAHGARLDRLADGALIATLHGSGHAGDQAIRAARCALAMREAVKGVRLALATGRGEVTRASTVGEVIDRAAALLTGTPGDASGVRIDDVTAGLVGARFEVDGDEHGLVLRSEREEVDSTRLVVGRKIPCMGRDREIAIVSALVAECFDEPAARVVLLVGPPGIGKSRLLHETLASMPPGTEVWSGRGDPVSAGSTLALLARAVRGAAGMRAGEAPALARQKLSALVARHVPPEERTTATEFLGEVVGTTMPESAALRAARQDAGLMADQMRAAFTTLLGAECSSHPVVLVLEDLHWADLATVRFVDAALRELAEQPLLVIATARAEALDVFPHLWEGRRVQQVRLEPLGRRASERIVSEALGAKATPDVTARIVGYAAGNPFFLEELIRRAAEGEHDSVPPTVIATMQARLLALEPDARRVLRAASVFGQNFWRGGIEKLVGEPTATVSRWLELLEDREVIARHTESRLAAESEYAFRHALLRDAAYAMLTESDRTLGHGLAGAWLEARGETDAWCLAEHYAAGGELSRAVTWYGRAAQQALDANDFTAVARVDRAIACGAEGAVRGALELVAGEAHVWAGNPGKALDRSMTALSLLPRGDHLWYRALGAASLYASRLSRVEVLQGLLDELEKVPPAPPSPSRVAALSQLCSALTHGGMRPHAQKLIVVAEREAAQIGDLEPFFWAHLRAGRGFVSAADDDAEAGLSGMSDAADAFEQAGALRSATSLQANAAYVLMLFGQYAAAERRLRRALAAAERFHLSGIVTFTKHNLGLVLANTGRLDDACPLERDAIEGFRSTGDRRGEGASMAYLSRMLLAKGDADAAAGEARAGLALLDLNADLRANAYAALSSATLALGDVPQALAAAREAKALLDEAGTLEEGEAIVRIAWTEALHASGDVEGARRAVLEARDRLLARAAAIRDPGLRRSFLEEVPEHARTMARAREWAGAAA